MGGLAHSFLHSGGWTPCRERAMQGWVHPSGEGLTEEEAGPRCPCAAAGACGAA